MFDGHELGLKKKRRKLRREYRRRWREKAQTSTTWVEYDAAMAKLTRVDGHVVRAFCDWARTRLPERSFRLFGDPFEADAQLAYLENTGFTNGTLSNDSDIYFYEGSKNIFSGFNTRSIRKYRSIIDRKTVDPYFAAQSGESLRMLSAFMGTDYIESLQGVGSRTTTL